MRNLEDPFELFQVIVDTTRHSLKCDRVLIYNVGKFSTAEVIAESVNDQSVSVLGKTIKDPFLTKKYLDLYRYGQATTINNFDSKYFSKQEIKKIKKLKIKSLIITPISIDQDLLFLLVAHQCSSSVPWHPESVNILIERACTASLALCNMTLIQEKQDFEPIDTDNRGINSNNGVNQKNDDNSEIEAIGKIEIKQYQKKLFAQVIDNITNEDGQENILNRTVKELHNLLKCDRVLVYSVNQNTYGAVIAESVNEGLTKVLGKTLEDSYLAAIYLDKYQHGRVSAWNNIYSGNTTPCYLEQLEALEVKANLVAPIISEDRLFGLLIVHQCNAAREWQEEEILQVTEITDQVGVMLEYTKLIAQTDAKDIKQSVESPRLSRSRLTGLRRKTREPALTAEVSQTQAPHRNPTQSALGQRGFVAPLQSEERLSVGKSKLNQNFTDVIQQIRESLTQEEILIASVKEVRRILQCDRVLIYSLNSDNCGTVMNESVTSGWTKAEGRVIKDPCFETKYMEQYLDGRVRAWNNIYAAPMSKCYIEQLEQLEVKANLVAPIIKEGKVFGLLVAQQCSSPRQWQQSEILWVSQITTQIGLALENAKLLADARELRRQVEEESQWTRYFTDAIQQIRQSLKRKDILQTSVREVRRILKCDRVLIYSLNPDESGTIIAESVTSGWTKSEGRVIKDPCFEARYIEQYLDGRVRAWNNIYAAGMSKCYIEQLEQLEVKANLVAPIINEGKVFGLLVAHQCSGSRQWQQSEIRWVAQISTQVGFALDNAELLKQLKQSTRDTQVILKHAQNSVSNIQRTVGDVSVRFNNLSHSYQIFFETIDTVKDLSRQITHKSMSLTRAINQSQIKEDHNNHIFDLSDSIFCLMQDLFEATGKIDPLFAMIQTEVQDQTTTLKSETQQLVSEVAQFQAAHQKLDQIVAMNHDMSNLIKVISKSMENQIQGSTFTKNSVQQVSKIAEGISQQSITITQSFEQLVTLLTYSSA